MRRARLAAVRAMRRVAAMVRRKHRAAERKQKQGSKGFGHRILMGGSSRRSVYLTMRSRLFRFKPV